MKNLCLVLACLSFISVLPSHAVKIIVNNENDRIVYSRSSGYEQEEYYEQDQNIQEQQPEQQPEQQYQEPEQPQGHNQEQQDSFVSENNNNENFDQNNSNGNGELNSYIRKSINENPDKYYHELGLLGQDFRTELAGTRWAYGMEEEPAPAPIAEENVEPMPEEQIAQENNEPVEEQMNQEPASEQIAQNDEDARIMQYRANLQRYKRGSREAADYYMVDMMKDPNNLVPSGYNQPY